MWVGEPDITKHNNHNYMWEMNSLDLVGVFSWQKTQDQEPYRDHRPCKLSEFMPHVVEKCRVKSRIDVP